MPVGLLLSVIGLQPGPLGGAQDRIASPTPAWSLVSDPSPEPGPTTPSPRPTRPAQSARPPPQPGPASDATVQPVPPAGRAATAPSPRRPGARSHRAGPRPGDGPALGGHWAARSPPAAPRRRSGPGSRDVAVQCPGQLQADIVVGFKQARGALRGGRSLPARADHHQDGITAVSWLSRTALRRTSPANESGRSCRRGMVAPSANNGMTPMLRSRAASTSSRTISSGSSSRRRPSSSVAVNHSRPIRASRTSEEPTAC